MSHELEKHWKHKGFDCAVIMTSMGHRCGYVGVREDHPLFNLPYHDHSDVLKEALEEALKGSIGKRGIIPIVCAEEGKASPDIVFDVHGGITYSSKDLNSEYPVKTEEPTWWFGYDCAHFGDGQDISKMSAVSAEIHSRFPDEGPVRSLGYCIKECENLADQFAALKQ